MSSNGTKAPYKVVVAIDFSTTAQGALARALGLANAQPHAEVHAVTVLEPHPITRAHDVPEDALEQLTRMSTEAVAQLAALGGPVHVDRVVTHLLTGDPQKEIVWLAAHLDADLIVVGTHGRQGIERIVLGSVAEHVLRNAGCPVLVVRPKAHPVELREPMIEPACEACVVRSNATQGVEKWCAQHAQHHSHAHVYSWSAAGAGGFRPWGFSGSA